MPITEELVKGLSPAQLKDLAVTMAVMVAPYGVVASAIIEPARFQMFIDRLATSGQQDLSDLVVECEAVIDQFVDDEPTDAGFYAFGAVVSVYYACCASLDAGDGGLNAAKRFLDLAGAADDDGCAGLLALANDFVANPSAAARSEITLRITEHAATLS
jgi:hypothetical protein